MKTIKSTMKRSLTRDECADQLDISPDTLAKYTGDGCPCLKRPRGNLFNAAEVLAWMRGNNRTGNPGRPSEGSPELLQARIRKERALARRYEFEADRQEGKFWPAEGVIRANTQMITTARNQFLNLGGEISAALEGKDAAERDAIISERVREILTDLAERMLELPDMMEAEDSHG